MNKYHFLASSVAEWHIDSDIKRLIKFMDKRGFNYTLWYVPVDLNDDYEIKYFIPQVDGSKFLGEYQPKSK